MHLRSTKDYSTIRRRALLGAAVAIAAVACCETHIFADQARPSGTVDVSRQVRAIIEADWIECDRLFAAGNRRPDQPVRVNSLGVTTTQDASGAVDGIKNGRFGFHVAVGETDPWWQVDLGKGYKLDRVVIYNRTDGGHAARTRNIAVQVARDDSCDRFESVYQHDGSVFYGANENRPL
ncbi:MAG: discoidin domain-containing protein, partial [Planctomycetota bacterium]